MRQSRNQIEADVGESGSVNGVHRTVNFLDGVRSPSGFEQVFLKRLNSNANPIDSGGTIAQNLRSIKCAWIDFRQRSLRLWQCRNADLMFAKRHGLG